MNGNLFNISPVHGTDKIKADILIHFTSKLLMNMIGELSNF